MKDTASPFTTPRRMLYSTMGSMDSRVMDPPHGNFTILTKLRAVASAIIIAPSTRDRISSFRSFLIRIPSEKNVTARKISAGHTTKRPEAFPENAAYAGIIRIR